MLSKLQNLDFPTKLFEVYQASAKPVFPIVLREQEDYTSLGNSRIGGYPDLPKQVEYPRDLGNSPEKDRYYNFIAQINLSEVPGQIDESMPKEGILYFFLHNDDESMSEVNHLVYYWNGTSSDLQKFQAPAGIKFTGDAYEKPFPAYKISFESDHSIDLHHLEDHCQEELQQNEQLYDLFDRRSRFGGHSYSADGYLTPQIVYYQNLLSYDERHLLYQGYLTGEKDFATESSPLLQQYEEKLKIEKSIISQQFYQSQIREIHRQRAVENSKKGQEEAYKKILNDWILLIAINSIDECEMLWWDSSVLEFYINRNELKQLDFSSTFCLINH